MTSCVLSYPINITVCDTRLLRLVCEFSDARSDRNGSHLPRIEDGKVSSLVVTARSYSSNSEQN